MDQQILNAFRDRAAETDGIDREVYEACGKDPLQPVVGLGEPNCRIGFFGRDPGKDEIRHGMPFIGAGGQKVRRELYRRLYAAEMPDFAASVSVGEGFFWANTVPYKPIGNKAWSMKVKKSFQPLMADLLLNQWHGADIITLGREAFLWFSIHQSREIKQQLEAFWTSDDRFVSSCEIEFCLADGRCRIYRLHPLPHPSPLNAIWYKKFPGLLGDRLAQLAVTKDTLYV